MTDKETVVKGLEICYSPLSKCDDCPYHNLPDEQSCNDVLCLDALALLKTQEAVKPSWSRGKPFCGACGLRIHGGKFCSECGKPIAWGSR